jgi:beta-glucosidase
MSSYGDSFLTLDGAPVQSDAGIETWSSRQTTNSTIELQAGDAYRFSLDWFSQVPAQPTVHIQDVTAVIAAAVATAEQVTVPIVFARDAETEGEDRQSLALPGYQDALISAVAAANPRTVVVLNTGGAVLTPWLRNVAALLEAWYPGEEDGNAIAAVLLGRVDPSGRLPVTFPVSQAAQPLASPGAWPGIDGTVRFSSGLGIGYRGYIASGVKMRFPFGFGLAYTRFALSGLTVDPVAAGYRVSVMVDNLGHRAGRETVEVYLGFPSGAGEPPEQLVGIASVELAAGATGAATLILSEDAFEADLSGHWRVVPGSYDLSVGTSATRLLLHDTIVAAAG